MRTLLFISIILVGFTSCEKKEIPVAPHVPGDAIVTQIDMGSDYKDQIWFNLHDNEIVSRNLKAIWDLSFESTEDGWHVLLNSSKTMAVCFFEGLEINDEITIEEAVWTWDTHSGSLDSTAIGDWRGNNGVYLLDRGYDHTGTHQGFKKLKINAVDNLTFSIEYSDLDGSGYNEITLPKNTNLKFTPFSFLEDDQLPVIMPHKEQWDIVFTQYTYIYYDLEEITPYQVTGVLLNRNNVEARKMTDVDFEDVDLEYAAELFLKDRIDEIGYEWKFYNFDEGFYTVLSEQVFIIKDVEGLYYKLRFTGFYSDSGEKGYPKFEFQKL